MSRRRFVVVGLIDIIPMSTQNTGEEQRKRLLEALEKKAKEMRETKQT